MKLNRMAALIAILLLGIALLAGVLMIGATGVAIATGGNDDTEPPIAGDALDSARAAALEHTGGGRVTETEVCNEEGYYEVEVTLAGGRQVDVHLDQDFNVIGQEAEGHDPDELEGIADD